jgi:hypothetical protein
MAASCAGVEMAADEVQVSSRHIGGSKARIADMLGLIEPTDAALAPVRIDLNQLFPGISAVGSQRKATGETPIG